MIWAFETFFEDEVWKALREMSYRHFYFRDVSETQTH